MRRSLYCTAAQRAAIWETKYPPPSRVVRSQKIAPSPERMIDFASGLTFGLQGTIERVGGKVFLLTPKGVDVAASVKNSLV